MAPERMEMLGIGRRTRRARRKKRRLKIGGEARLIKWVYLTEKLHLHHHHLHLPHLRRQNIVAVKAQMSQLMLLLPINLSLHRHLTQSLHRNLIQGLNQTHSQRIHLRYRPRVHLL